MKIIIISGIPASGKTTIAKKVSDQLAIPLHTKDQEKEKLFSSESKSTYLRWGWYEKRANEMLFQRLRECVDNNQDVIIESNFIPSKDRKKVLAIAKGQDICEVYCTAKGWTILKRFITRNESKNRTKHKSNHDRFWYGTMAFFCILKFFKIDYPHTKLAINDKVLTVDTTDFTSVDYKKIYEFCR